LKALRNGTLGILLVDLGGDAILILQVALELLDVVVHLLGGLLDLGNSDLVVLFSFLVLEFEVATLTLLFQGLVLLPVLHALLEPLFHEASISCNLVDLGSSHFLEHPLTSLPFLSITFLCDMVLSHLLIIKLLLVTLH
jgi:hypothetical protein